MAISKVNRAVLAVTCMAAFAFIGMGQAAAGAQPPTVQDAQSQLQGRVSSIQEDGEGEGEDAALSEGEDIVAGIQKCLDEADDFAEFQECVGDEA
ncbi:hypothetical protein DFR70_106337 [Nocardia tenerifensis]|uniref:Secreted protein n=1 Tax=Nocardia tenerifensis TaxID=228006 RepID=A0A318JZV1_9NOCA|nr:hypothetical protein [Nocardia tenerifensis]PXX63277.1 hypothetical protein DFR70_106337 [Nocardia tenerifensis]